MRWMMAVTLPKTTACIRAGGTRASEIMTPSEHLSEFWDFFFCVSHNKLTAHEHNADGEDFLSICVGTHVAKTNAGETAEGEVEGGDVGAGHGGPTHGAVDVRCLQTLSQLLQPAWGARSDGGCIRVMWVSKVTNHCFYFFFVSTSMDDPFAFGK